MTQDITRDEMIAEARAELERCIEGARRNERRQNVYAEYQDNVEYWAFRLHELLADGK